MDIIYSPIDMKQAIMAAWVEHRAELEERAATAIAADLAQASPVGLVVTTMEAVYAGRDTLGDEWLKVGAQAAHLVMENGWHDKGERAGQILPVMRRELGEIKGPAASHDPDVDARFAPVEEETEG